MVDYEVYKKNLMYDPIEVGEIVDYNFELGKFGYMNRTEAKMFFKENYLKNISKVEQMILEYFNYKFSYFIKKKE